MKKISNPLTIIGLFAGIAEIAGTVVLPLVSEDLQGKFIWYVMGFPVLLVVAFFLTLIFKPSSLYAPSDFSDESNYVKLNMAKMGKQVEGLIERHPDMAAELEGIQNTILEGMSKDDARMHRRQLEIIDIISETGNGITMFELANRMGTSKSFAHRLLVDMTKDGLLVRVNNEDRNGDTTRARYRYILANKEAGK